MPQLNVGDVVVTRRDDTINDSYTVEAIEGNFVTRVRSRYSNDYIGCNVNMDDLYLLKPKLPIKEAVCLKIKEMDERFTKRHLIKGIAESIKYQRCMGDERVETDRANIIERALQAISRWEAPEAPQPVESIGISGYSYTWSSEPNVLSDDQYALGA